MVSHQILRSVVSLCPFQLLSSCVLSCVLFVCVVDFLGLTNSIPTRSLFLPGCLSFLPVDLYV